MFYGVTRKLLSQTSFSRTQFATGIYTRGRSRVTWLVTTDAGGRSGPFYRVREYATISPAVTDIIGHQSVISRTASRWSRYHLMLRLTRRRRELKTTRRSKNGNCAAAIGFWTRPGADWSEERKCSVAIVVDWYEIDQPAGLATRFTSHIVRLVSVNSNHSSQLLLGLLASRSETVDYIRRANSEKAGFR